MKNSSLEGQPCLLFQSATWWLTHRTPQPCLQPSRSDHPTTPSSTQLCARMCALRRERLLPPLQFAQSSSPSPRQQYQKEAAQHPPGLCATRRAPLAAPWVASSLPLCPATLSKPLHPFAISCKAGVNQHTPVQTLHTAFCITSCCSQCHKEGIPPATNRATHPCSVQARMKSPPTPPT